VDIPFTHHEPLPPGSRSESLRAVADDGVESWGLLHEPAGAPPRACVVLAHPRVEFSRHYLVPGLLRAGLAVLGHDLRTLHNDADVRHDKMLLDVAAGLRLVRARYERIVLLGNSGGGPLFAGYQAQAAPAQRGDLFVVLAAHAGEGRFLMQAIDPSVVDEADPLSCDPELDMFNPANGYDLATRSARYAPEFLARYRAAQRARVARLDAAAQAQIDAERAARQRLGAGLAPYDLLRTARAAIPHRLMIVYRTVANPAYLDLTIDPNDRDPGSIFGLLDGRPEFGNHYVLNVARVLTPRAWLSVWSGLSSRSDFLAAAPALTVPTLFMPAAGDSDILPADADAMWAAIGAPDKTRHDLRGADHYLRPTRRHSGRPPREEALDALVEWIRARV
jgi:hypothetical protein